MSQLTYAKHERVWLKNHPELNERWLQQRIAEDPVILGLGEVMLLERERPQERAGRLDLLLADLEQAHRYEVELMLGPTDESHIIRCIEYWDIERRRYPAYDHCAVLVAEDITSRFLNVLSLMSGTIPLVAIQLNALQVGEQVILDFVHVLDQRRLRRDDVLESRLQSVDRSYWLEKSSKAVIDLADNVLEIINEAKDQKLKLNYNKYYIGLIDGAQPHTFITFRPRKRHLRVVVVGGWTDERSTRLDEAGFEAEQHDGDNLVFNITPAEFPKNRDVVAAVIKEYMTEEES
jgi:hypothetical protein